MRGSKSSHQDRPMTQTERRDCQSELEPMVCLVRMEPMAHADEGCDPEPGDYSEDAGCCWHGVFRDYMRK